MAVNKQPNDILSGGSINIGHPIRVTALGVASQSVLASIVRLLERAQAERAPVARIADRIASWFVLTTLTLAGAVALFWLFVEPMHALPAALAVLVVTCPCALSLATPTAIAGATARLARLGLMVTRADALERLARMNLVVVVKTGTLTRGVPSVDLRVLTPGYTRDRVLACAAALESRSDHPIAAAFRPYFDSAVTVSALREFAARGVEGVIDGVVWRLGTDDFVAQSHRDTLRGSTVTLGNSNGIAAVFAVSDSLRPDAKDSIGQLRSLGLALEIASGDHQEVVCNVARQLGVRAASGRLTPEQKLAVVLQRQSEGARVLMVGDGINDAPVLAAASVSCAMAQGSAIAQSAADLLLLNESLGALAEGVRTARRMRAVIRQNLGWALVYNLAAVPLAAAGLIPPWVAAIGMSLSSLLVVLNAARLTL